jgi:hypothetical protein
VSRVSFYSSQFLSQSSVKVKGSSLGGGGVDEDFIPFVSATSEWHVHTIYKIVGLSFSTFIRDCVYFGSMD